MRNKNRETLAELLLILLVLVVFKYFLKATKAYSEKLPLLSSKKKKKNYLTIHRAGYGLNTENKPCSMELKPQLRKEEGK